MTAGLTEEEVMSLVYDYVGVSEDGYLKGFTYRSHAEFYARFCGLSVDVPKQRGVHGTTRNTFLAILRDAKAEDQARIVEGTFKSFPVESFPEEERAARAKAQRKLLVAVERLRGQGVNSAAIATSNETVQRAIRDADVLIREQGNTSGVDRVHTALHGYVRTLCVENGIQVEADIDAARLLKKLRTEVAAFQPAPARADDIGRLQGALATIIDALNPIRNQASMAHPNENLLQPAEAALAIDAARSLLNYLSRKALASGSSPQES